MKNVPELFDQILYKNLRPWLDTNKPDEKFFPMISAVENFYPAFQSLYEVDFYKPFNNKTKYYQKLILNGSNKYCNFIIELINEDDNVQVQKYWLNDTLNKKLRTRLNDIGKLIKDNDYSLLYINPYKTTFNEDADHKTDTYIIQLLKNALIKVYLEIQNVFSLIYADNLLEEQEIYTQFLFEPIPEKSFIKQFKQIIDIEHIAVNAVSVPETKTTKAKAKTFKYNKLATNSEAFKDLLDSLKLNKLVDKKTTIHDLKKIFTGVDEFKPVVWSGNISDLYYFIVLLHNEYKLVESISPYHWQVTCNCFIKSDGTTFDTTQLKTQKKPKINAEMIEKLASLLK